MNDLAEKLAYFKEKQAEIATAIEAFRVEESKITAEYNQKLEETKQAGEMKIQLAKNKINLLLEPYKAEQKAYFGTCTGETADLMQLIELMHKIASATK